MKGKILFVVGLGVGYVLGTRAGRERYDQIKRAAESVWNQPAVQRGVSTVKDFAMSKVGDLSDTVLDNVKQFVGSATKSSGGSSDFRRAAQKTATGVSDAAKRAADTVSDAVEHAADAAEDAADAVEDAAEKAQRSATTGTKPTGSSPTSSSGAGRAKPAASDT